MADRERLSVQVDAELASSIRKVAADHGMRLSDVIREALRKGLTTFGTPRAKRKEPTVGIVEDPFG